MAAIGIHASHEQIAPSALLQAMREAEATGFQRAWSSDHFSPWSERALHHVGRDQRAFIEAFGEHVVPRL